MSIDAMKRIRADHVAELEKLSQIITTIESGKGGPFALDGSEAERKQYRVDRLADYKKQAEALRQLIAEIDDELGRNG